MILNFIAGEIFSSWWFPALCVAIIVVLLLIIFWIGSISDKGFEVIKWVGIVGVPLILTGGWMVQKSKSSLNTDMDTDAEVSSPLVVNAE